MPETRQSNAGGEPGGRPTNGGGQLGDYGGRRGAYPTRGRVALLIGLLALTFFVAKGCQDKQIELTQAEAVELAKKQVDFEPSNVQIRLLRQGLDRRPIWIVSLSIARGEGGPNPDTFKRLALIRIDATEGTVESVEDRDPSVLQGKGDGPAAEEEAGVAEGTSSGKN